MTIQGEYLLEAARILSKNWRAVSGLILINTCTKLVINSLLSGSKWTAFSQKIAAVSGLRLSSTLSL